MDGSQTGQRTGLVAVAMSGGVDSSVAAALLREQGEALVGVTARMADVSRCCAEDDIRRASDVAAKLGIPHHVIDVRDAFRKAVIDYFTAEYGRGRTPSPCAVCNRRIKFGVLFDAVRELGAQRLATGHYARIDSDGECCFLRRGRDPGKDQSYFLSRLSPAQIERSMFPVGDMTKQSVTAYGREHGLASRGSRESQELCFVVHGTHGDWMDACCLKTPGPGEILDTRGRAVGRHRGIHHYTVGQRKGLGIALGRPAYVVEVDPERNVVVVGDRQDAMSAGLEADRAVWAGGKPPAAEFRALTQIRYNHAGADADVRLCGDGALDVRFDSPQFAVTPGQLAVFYRGDRVTGSAWIRCRRP